MTLDELKKLDDGLARLSDRFLSLPEHREKALEISLHCQYVKLVVGELAMHLANGVDPYEALCNTALGILPVEESKATLLKILTVNPKQ